MLIYFPFVRSYVASNMISYDNFKSSSQSHYFRSIIITCSLILVGIPRLLSFSLFIIILANVIIWSFVLVLAFVLSFALVRPLVMVILTFITLIPTSITTRIRICDYGYDYYCTHDSHHRPVSHCRCYESQSDSYYYSP